jgi:hypothetical protein
MKEFLMDMWDFYLFGMKIMLGVILIIGSFILIGGCISGLYLYFIGAYTK